MDLNQDLSLGLLANGAGGFLSSSRGWRERRIHVAVKRSACRHCRHSLRGVVLLCPRCNAFLPGVGVRQERMLLMGLATLLLALAAYAAAPV